jgi:hypothetical protein
MLNFKDYEVMVEFNNLKNSILKTAKKINSEDLAKIIESYLQEEQLLENNGLGNNDMPRNGFLGSLKNAWNMYKNNRQTDKQHSGVSNSYKALTSALQTFQTSLQNHPQASSFQPTSDLLNSLQTFSTNLSSYYSNLANYVRNGNQNNGNQNNGNQNNGNQNNGNQNNGNQSNGNQNNGNQSNLNPHAIAHARRMNADADARRMATNSHADAWM